MSYLPPVIVFDLWGTLVHAVDSGVTGVEIPALHERGTQVAMLYDDVLKAVEKLRQGKRRIGICSNLDFEYVEAMLALVPGMDSYSFSCQVGARKPDPKIYQHVVDQLRCRPADVLFIGDSRRKDFDGPRAFGMKAALIDRKAGETIEEVIARATVRR